MLWYQNRLGSNMKREHTNLMVCFKPIFLKYCYFLPVVATQKINPTSQKLKLFSDLSYQIHSYFFQAIFTIV